jgi:hypothetical protein
VGVNVDEMVTLREVALDPTTLQETRWPTTNVREPTVAEHSWSSGVPEVITHETGASVGSPFLRMVIV